MLATRTSRSSILRPTLRGRMALLYAALICTSGITLLGVTYLLAPGLLIHRAWAPASHQPGAPAAGHTSGVFSSFIGSEAFRAAVIAVAIMAVFSLALGWLIAGRFTGPLRSIITTARDISASNLHRRLGLGGRGDEFTELGETLDDLFARLEASFDSQRHFIANASHELRTPLSAGRALLQVAIADPEPTVETLLATCQELVDLGDQQERLIAALLSLANGQRGLARTESLDLADIARKVILGRPGDRRPEPGRKPDRQPRRQRHPAQPARRPGGHHDRPDRRGRRHNGGQHRHPDPPGRGGLPVPALPAARHPADPPR
jgi:signal transduction histidine kinase